MLSTAILTLQSMSECCGQSFVIADCFTFPLKDLTVSLTIFMPEKGSVIKDGDGHCLAAWTVN